MENLTPEQQFENDLIDAEVLAREANKLFDDRLKIARSMASALGSLASERYATRFIKVNYAYNALVNAAVALMPPRTAFEIPEPIEPFASEAVWNAMSKEQQLKAVALKTAMAEQLSGFGITTDSLRVVMSETEEENKTFTLVHIGNGIDIGDHTKELSQARSYNVVMSRKNEDLFTIKLDGNLYDLRSGMTSSTYDALYEDAIRQGYTLPDSDKMALENHDQIRTWTMLTGEPLTAGGLVQVRYVDDGRVYGLACYPEDGNRSLRVRVAVVIE